MAFWPKGKAFEGREAQPPSFFVSFEPDRIRLGTGCMAFSKTALGSYLHALESGSGNEIAELMSDLEARGFERSTPDLAKAPRGFPKDHEHARPRPSQGPGCLDVSRGHCSGHGRRGGKFPRRHLEAHAGLLDVARGSDQGLVIQNAHLLCRKAARARPILRDSAAALPQDEVLACGKGRRSC